MPLPIHSRKLDISVLIPFKDKSEMTLDCVRSFIKYGPGVKEIILISNNSSSDELRAVQLFAKQYGYIKVLVYDMPFNYQKMNNWAVEQSTGETLLFMNNDIELRPNSIGLLEKMLEKSKENKVGITGCLLLYGDEKTIQHAGVYLMPEGQADHLYITERYKAVLTRNNTAKYPYDIQQDRALTAVTGAVSMVTRKKFMDVGMYDENFIIGGGDVDLCIRLNQSGLQTWYIAGGYILHKESQSRKKLPIPYSDFYWSYLSYIKGYDIEVGDPFLSEVTKKIRIYGA